MRKPCCDKQETNKGAWSKQEDQKLIDYINTHGEGCWRSLPKAAGLHRCGKSCRLRWINYLRPDLKRGNFGQDEEDLIIKLHALLGNRWSLIAGRLPGRTDNEVKNYWNSHIKRKLIKMGVDPNNHRLTLNLPPIANNKPAAPSNNNNPNHSVSSASAATSSESSMDNNDDNYHHALFNNIKPVMKKSLVDEGGADHGRCLSDTTTTNWNEDDHQTTSGTASLLIDLNLDLTIAVPACPPSSSSSSSSPLLFIEANKKPTTIKEWTMAREVDQTDTLLLFT